MTPRRRAARVLLAAVISQALLAALRLPAPDELTWGAVDRWYVEVGPSVAAIALLRVAAQVAAGWLVLASVLQLAAARTRRPGLPALADRLAPRFLRSVACGAASLSLGVGLAGPAVPAVAGGPPPGTAVMVPLDVPTTVTPSTTTAPSSTTTTTPSTTTTVPAPAPPPAPPSAVGARAERVVRPGDSFWSIAEAEAGAGEVEGYWRTLVDENRDRLVDRGNPDLLYPGQVLRLPAR